MSNKDDFNYEPPDWDHMVYVCNELAKQTEISLIKIAEAARSLSDLLYGEDEKPIKPKQPHYQKFNKSLWRR